MHHVSQGLQEVVQGVFRLQTGVSRLKNDVDRLGGAQVSRQPDIIPCVYMNFIAFALLPAAEIALAAQRVAILKMYALQL